MPTRFPENPIEALSSELAHAYYLQKLQGPAVYYDATLSSWLVFSANLTEQVLQHPACKVRPLNLAIPANLNGRPSARFFANLVRMNDGPSQQLAKQVIVLSLSALAAPALQQASQLAVEQLQSELALATHFNPVCLNQWINAYPLYCLANLIGLADSVRRRLPELVSALVACLSPLSKENELDQADLAFQELFGYIQTVTRAQPLSPLLGNLGQHAQKLNWQDQTALLINLCAWFTQAYDGCRGLISSALIRLRNEPGVRQKVATQSNYLELFLREVCRLDSPIQNTRRYTSTALELDGQVIPENQQILLVLAAANLDSSSSVNPTRFSPETNTSAIYTFGLGTHRCPGQNLAMQFSTYALQQLIPLQAWTLCQSHRYQSSVNARIAIFHETQGGN